MGTPVVVDWDLDFFADTTYFGLVGDPAEEKGMIMRMYFDNQEDPSMWESMHTFYQSNRPINVQAAPGIDNKKNKWIFFGTGRYYSEEDKSDVLRQSLFGIKDDETGSTVNLAELLETTDAEVFSDGQLQTPLPSLSGTQLNTFKDIENEIDTVASGWKMDLPAIIGTVDPDPATRNLTRSALFGGVLFSTVFQPSSDPCAGEGNSRLYGLFYKTGTAFPSPSVLGSNIVQHGNEVKYLSKKYLDLGAGFATSPAIHSGSGAGGESIRVLTQLSTGDIVTSPAEPVFNVRTGRTAWGEN
jgi:type IV pilus assembly protein PilY1